jgi:hypothetical protein
MLAKRTKTTHAGVQVRITILALLCWVSIFALSVGSASAKDCGLKLLGSTDLRVGYGGPVQVQVTVNDHPATMQLSTASVVSAIRFSQVEPLGLQARTTNYNSFIVNRKTMKQFAIPNSFAVGSYQLERPPFYLYPDDTPMGATSGADIGWLGMDLLWAGDFELDFANNKLSFYSAKHCSGGAVYWTEKYRARR